MSIAVISVGFGLFSLIPGLQAPSYTKDQLTFSELNGTLYLKKKVVWQDETAVISTSSNLEFEPDSASEHIYELNGSPLLYKQTADSLIVYIGADSRTPVNFRSKIGIKQVELDNPKMMRLLDNQTYLKLGLKRMN